MEYLYYIVGFCVLVFAWNMLKVKFNRWLKYKQRKNMEQEAREEQEYYEKMERKNMERKNK